MKTKYRITNPKATIMAIQASCEKIQQKTILTSGSGFKVNAKSLIGSVYAAAEWKDVFMEFGQKVPEDFIQTLLDANYIQEI